MIRRRVIKIGGSCLSNSQLPERLQRFLQTESDAQNLIVIGGGACIDAMRDLNNRFSLNQAQMHWRCVDLLRTSLEVLAELLPRLRCVTTGEEFYQLLAAERKPASYLIAVDVFYNRDTSALSGLPVGWATTTDSIAAYLAKISHADQLILIKSCSIETADLNALAQQGFVDQAFPEAAPRDISIEFLNIQRMH